MNVRLKYDMNFNAGFYYNDQLYMNNYSMRLWMTTNCKEPADQNTAFKRMEYFVYSELDSTIFINQRLQEQCEHLINAGLNVTTMPEDPVDQLIGIMLYHKLNAITENHMVITDIELSSTHGESIWYLHSTNELTPDIKQPEWWTSVDPIHCEFDVETTDKVVELAQPTTWRDLELNWSSDMPESALGNTVVFADFKKPHED